MKEVKLDDSWYVVSIGDNFECLEVAQGDENVREVIEDMINSSNNFEIEDEEIHLFKMTKHKVFVRELNLLSVKISK